jgi:NAD(P)-dependent dehydrogenase (short-subunit alcohol dehydrogenase family)
MDLELAGKVALATGVSQGIGLAVAEVLAAEGMLVAGNGRAGAHRCTACILTPSRFRPENMTWQ